MSYQKPFQTHLTMEIPLLVRDDGSYNMTDFWSPARPFPRAPPSSPKLHARKYLDEHLCKLPDGNQSLAYLNQQLQNGVLHREAHDSKLDRLGNYLDSCHDTEYSSDDECTGVIKDADWQALRNEDDIMTLVNTSSTSKVNTISEDVESTPYKSFNRSIDRSPAFPYAFRKPWTSASRTNLSFPKDLKSRSSSSAGSMTMHEPTASSHSRTLNSQIRFSPVKRSISLNPTSAVFIRHSESKRLQVCATLDPSCSAITISIRLIMYHCENIVFPRLESP